MSVETFVPSTKLISLTDSAVKHFESKLKDKPGQLIRLSTKVSGCTGYAYVLDFADSAQADDEIVEIESESESNIEDDLSTTRGELPAVDELEDVIYSDTDIDIDDDIEYDSIDRLGNL